MPLEELFDTFELIGCFWLGRGNGFKFLAGMLEYGPTGSDFLETTYALETLFC